METGKGFGSPQRNSAISRAVGDPISRRKFIAMTGGSAALTAFLTACGGDGSTTTSTTSAATTSGTERFGKGDIGILNYALTLEYLETAFYKDAVGRHLFKGENLETMRRFGAEEAEHVAALTAAVKKLGGKPAPIPRTEFPITNEKSALNLASELENLGAAAYLGQLPNIESSDVLETALAIHSVEGRHASATKKLIGESITTYGAIEPPLEPETVLKLIEPYVVG
jgi:rubrerythrin